MVPDSMRCVFRVHYLTQMGEHLQMVLDGKPIRLQTESMYSPEQYDVVLM